MPSSVDLEFARASLRRFARATNLLLTGRSFAVLGDDGRADAVRDVLLRCGAREAAVLRGGSGLHEDAADEFPGTPGATSTPDYVFITSDIDWADAAAYHAPLVVDLHGSLIERVTDRARPAVRDGILRVDGVDLAPADPHRPPRAPLPEAAGRMEWAGQHMPLTASFARELREDGLLAGIRIAVSMVLEPKTAVLALALRDVGADVSVFAHRYETDEQVATELRGRGIPVFADASGDAAHDRELALHLLDTVPQLLLDDGAHVIRLAHDARPELVDTMIGAAEETTSGVRALRELGDALRMPVVAVNDAITKTRFDNRYGTGQSCVFAIADTLEAASAAKSSPISPGLGVSSFDGATVAVIGFGPVGQGVGQFARALGADVRVADLDPRAELEARFAGHATDSVDALIAGADIVVSATGTAHTITLDHLKAAADGTVFAVAGGVDDEIEVAGLRAFTQVRRVDDHIEVFAFDDGRTVSVIDDGGCVNITAGEGNPIEIMDLSFAAQLQAVRTLIAGSSDEGADSREPRLFALTADADREIARRALGASQRPNPANERDESGAPS